MITYWTKSEHIMTACFWYPTTLWACNWHVVLCTVHHRYLLHALSVCVELLREVLFHVAMTWVKYLQWRLVDLSVCVVPQVMAHRCRILPMV